MIAVPDMPRIGTGDDLAALVVGRLASAGEALRGGDVVVFAQKIVSKSEGRLVSLRSVTPSPAADAVARATGKPARLVALILSETRRIVRQAANLLIVEDRRGFVSANAGIDQSNVGPEGDDLALLLPEDPDGSAERLRSELRRRSGQDVAVVINDSFGRAWRLGTVGVALGAAGLPALVDRRGEPDLFGRTLQATTIGIADEVAAAASLLMGGADEGRPVVILRGLDLSGRPHRPAASLLRPGAEDLFR